MRPAPGKWSPRELVGHLVDSASNNHQRFVRARFVDHLDFPGYDQDEWVAGQDYAGADWASLVTLWAEFNRHLARVMQATPEAALTLQRSRHSLDRIAFRPVPVDRPVTLEGFMQDYVEHLRHHLAGLVA